MIAVIDCTTTVNATRQFAVRFVFYLCVCFIRSTRNCSAPMVSAYFCLFLLFAPNCVFNFSPFVSSGNFVALFLSFSHNLNSFRVYWISLWSWCSSTCMCAWFYYLVHDFTESRLCRLWKHPRRTLSHAVLEILNSCTQLIYVSFHNLKWEERK